MVARVSTVAFQGIEGVPVEVQVMIAPGKMMIQIVGLPDTAVAESRERVQAALHASGLSLPPKKVTINLAPADLPKEGSHFDLPIALGILVASGQASLSCDLAVTEFYGELGLTGELKPVPGLLLAALHAAESRHEFYVPSRNAPPLHLAGLTRRRTRCWSPPPPAPGCSRPASIWRSA